MSEIFGGSRDRKDLIKEAIRKLHTGVDPDRVKEEFKEALEGLGPEDIARIEEELIEEGIPREEIHRLCDLLLAIFRESLEKERGIAPEGHPIHTLMEEHKVLLQLSMDLRKTIGKIKDADKLDEIGEELDHLNHIIEHLRDSEKHYLREENVLFPYIERHGITGPPAIMWSEHNEIRKIKKRIYEVMEERKPDVLKSLMEDLSEASISLSEMLQSHFYKENNILFPTALRVIEESEWKEIEEQFGDIGYCCFTPESARREVRKIERAPITAEGEIMFETGSISREELEAILNTLPVDITFVDKEDTVKYFNQSKERIFLRTKAVIGRKVQLCHPQKSLHKVEQILNDFKNNKRDVAEFWINSKGRTIYIRYFAVRKNGEYLGTLEVTQDITEIKKIEGEKRLLD